jgi:hypothetical protein
MPFSLNGKAMVSKTVSLWKSAGSNPALGVAPVFKKTAGL